MEGKNFKKINEQSLSLSNDAQKIISQILERSVKIEYFIDEAIEGKAACSPPDEKGKIKIIFRDEKSTTDYAICHELLHLHLFVVRGYPKINSGWENFRWAVVALDNIFSHIMITPKLQELNYFDSFIEEEYSATKRTIDCFKKEIEKNPSSMDFKTFSIVLYVRAKKEARFTEVEFRQFEEYLKKTNNSSGEILYDEKTIKAIGENLPQPDCGIEDYDKLLRKCVEELHLLNDVDFTYFKKN